MERDRLNNGDDLTQFTNSSGVISNITDLENETDEFGRQILEHARRDQQRMRDATNDGSVQAFKRARPRPGIALTMENLERNNATLINGKFSKTTRRRSIESPTAYAPGQNSVSESDNSNPLNVPSQWGRKGIQKNEFLRRISATAPPSRDDVDLGAKKDADIIYRRRPTYTGDSPRSDVNWPPSPGINPRRSTEHDTSLPKVLTYGVSSHSPDRDQSIDRMLEDQLPSMESPVTEAGMRRRSIANKRPDNFEAVVGTGMLRNRSDVMGGKIPRRRRTPEPATSNVQELISNVPGERLETLDKESSVKENIEALVVAVKSTKDKVLNSSSLPQHKTSDQGSRDILKQIARASSSTPDSANQMPSKQSKLPIRSEDINSPSKVNPPTSSNISTGRLASPQKTNNHQGLDTEGEDGAKKKGKLVAKLVNTFQCKPSLMTIAQTSTHKVETQNEDEIPQVAGLMKEEPPINYERKHEGPPTRPHPRSAVDALLRHPDNLGESTIASLRDVLVDSTEDAANFSALDDETFDLVQKVGVPLSAGAQYGEKERKAEMDTLNRMDERLRAARSGLRDASRGLKRVEREVEDASPMSEDDETTKSPTVSRQCSKCEEITLTTLLTKAWKWFLGNFIVWDRGKGKRKWPSLTWLGLFCSILFAWSFSEVTLCEFYCHPFEAYYMDGYGVDIYAPKMPYVTSTVLVKRPLQRIWWFWKDIYDVLVPLPPEANFESEPRRAFAADDGFEHIGTNKGLGEDETL